MLISKKYEQYEEEYCEVFPLRDYAGQSGHIVKAFRERCLYVMVPVIVVPKIGAGIRGTTYVFSTAPIAPRFRTIHKANEFLLRRGE